MIIEIQKNKEAETMRNGGRRHMEEGKKKKMGRKCPVYVKLQTNTNMYEQRTRDRKTKRTTTKKK